MLTSMFQLIVDSSYSAGALIAAPIVYVYNLVYLIVAKIVGAFILIVNWIFGAICWVIYVISFPFVLLFRLISYVCGVVFSAVTTSVYFITVHAFNILFTYENVESDTWLDFLLNLRPTFTLVFLLVAVLLWQHFKSRMKLENESRKFCSRLAENRKLMDSSDNISRVLDFAIKEASRYIVDKQPLPDVDTRINVRLTECHLTALGGVVEDVNSLSLEAATARREGSHLVLDVTAGLRHLRARYRRYAVHAPLDPLPPFYVSGEATMSVSPVILRLELVVQTPFSVRLRSFEVSKMGALQVDLTGLGDWNFLWTVGKWFAIPSAERELKNQIELQGKPIVEDVLRRVSSIATDNPMFRVLLSGAGDAGPGKELALAPAVVLTPAYLIGLAAIISAGAASLFLLPIRPR